MSKVKFSLDPSPTFDAPVPLPVHGGGTVEKRFTFKHRDRDALKQFLDTMSERSDVQTVMEMVKSWELDDDFNEVNVKRLVDNYLGSARAIYDTYLQQLSQAKRLN